MVQQENNWIEFTVQAGGKNFIGSYDPASLQGGILVKGASFDHVFDWHIDGSQATEARLSYVWIWDSTFVDLEGLDRFTNMHWLMITSSTIGSIAGIEKCMGLKEIEIRGCHLDSMAWVSPLANIEVLDLTRNDISRIEGVAGKQHLRILALNENKLTSTAGLEYLPAITGVSIAKNEIASIPNPGEVLDIIGRCHAAKRANPPSGGGFSDGDNPIHEIVQREANQKHQPIYLTLYYRERLAAMVPDLRRRLDAGEAVGMAYFKEGLRIEKAYLAYYGDDESHRSWVANEYRNVFDMARDAGFDVNIEDAGTDDDALVMRPVAGSSIGTLISELKRWFT